MDKRTPEQIHRNMSAVKSKNTRPELLVRRFLWARGFRFRLNSPRLPGHPDIVLRKYRTCVFVNGCFWHGHQNCSLFRLPQTHTEFWRDKIARNRRRDVAEQQRLADMGWHCVVVWECQLRPACRQQTLESLAYTLNHIFLSDIEHSYPPPVPDDAPAMAAEPLGEYGQPAPETPQGNSQASQIVPKPPMGDEKQ